MFPNNEKRSMKKQSNLYENTCQQNAGKLRNRDETKWMKKVKQNKIQI